MTELQHSAIGASSAERWIPCPGSVSLIRELGVSGRSTEESGEGDAAHDAAQHCILGSTDAWEMIGETFAGVEVNREMADGVQLYLNTIRPILTAAMGRRVKLGPALGKVVFIEHKFALTAVDEDAFGTVDFGAIVDKSLIEIVDFKYGVGVMKAAEANAQLLYYAAGLWFSLTPAQQKRITRIRMTIVQPRGWDESVEAVRSSKISSTDLLRWVNDTLRPGIMSTQAEDAPLVPGDHCQFCPAAANCPVLRAVFETVAEEVRPEGYPSEKKEAEKVAQEHAKTLENWEVGDLASRVGVVRIFMKAVDDELFHRQMSGHRVPGWKLVEKKANRVWRDDAEAILVEALGQEAYSKPKLLSAAQVTKLGKEGKALAAEYAFKPHGGLTTVPSSDKKVAVNRTPEEVFAHLNPQAANATKGPNT